MFSVEQQQAIIDKYLSGFSQKETAQFFDISGSAVFQLLKRRGISARTVAVGNSLKWDNDEFRKNQVAKRQGKPSGAKDKTWILDKRVFKPNLLGEKNPNWKGGTTALSKLIRNLPEYAFWRIEIFKRDWWTCQLCGAKNKVGEKYIFDADHIVPLHRLLSENQIISTEEAISCEALWDIINGRCLCRPCHMKTETWGLNA